MKAYNVTRREYRSLRKVLAWAGFKLKDTDGINYHYTHNNKDIYVIVTD